MIVTLTPNPSVDRSVIIPRLSFNEILRSSQPRLDWGGKGFNVSRALRLMDVNSLALAWVGGGAGKMLESGLSKLGIATDFVWVEEETRTNIVAREENSEWFIRINEPGPFIPPDAIDALLQKAQSHAHSGDIWVASGSLPRGVPEDFYARLIAMLHEENVRVFLDANAQALKLGAQALPFLMNPDSFEAQALVGFQIKNLDDAQRACLHFLRMGIQYIALDIPEEGLLLASQSVMILNKALKVPVINQSGIGDALMAALALGFSQNETLPNIARTATAFSSAWLGQAPDKPITKQMVTNLASRVEQRVINLL